jgi:hypothetical protein
VTKRQRNVIKEYIQRIGVYRLIRIKYLFIFYIACAYIMFTKTYCNTEQMLIVGFAWVFIGYLLMKEFDGCPE